MRQRLEESIRTNDLLKEQLEKRLAEVEKDPGTHPKLDVVLNICLCDDYKVLISFSTDLMNMHLCSAATNIFIHGNEEQGQLASEVRFLWEQNQALKEQLSVGSRGKTLSFFKGYTLSIGSLSVKCK